MNESERYTPKEAEEEAARMQALTEAGIAKDYTEAERLIRGEIEEGEKIPIAEKEKEWWNTKMKEIASRLNELQKSYPGRFNEVISRFGDLLMRLEWAGLWEVKTETEEESNQKES